MQTYRHGERQHKECNICHKLFWTGKITTNQITCKKAFCQKEKRRRYYEEYKKL